jgi:thiol-disulfide isomerase/thioredoxin
MLRAAISFMLASIALQAALVGDVRDAIGRNDYSAAEHLISAEKARTGETPETILAYSWLGRGKLAARQWDAADAYAEQTIKLVTAGLRKRPLDAEAQLPTALGAAIEVHGHALNGRGQRAEAVAYLTGELKRWRATSIRTRIQKNINLISLEGKVAPAIEMKEFIGDQPVSLAALKGKPVVLFFWAHWCSDCKRQGPILARLQKEFASKGLLVVGPTQRYGYVANGEDAAPAQETPYIAQIRRQYYGDLKMTVPVSEENFKNWGCSTTPTLALIDRNGIVRLYHPGDMNYNDLRERILEIVGS